MSLRECPHVSTTPEPGDIADFLKRNAAWMNRASGSLVCSKCKRRPPGGDRDLWLCLHCAAVFCGRGHKSHALAHYNDEPSHCVVLAPATSMMWCYECDDEVLDPDAAASATEGRVSADAPELRALARAGVATSAPAMRNGAASGGAVAASAAAAAAAAAAGRPATDATADGTDDTVAEAESKTADPDEDAEVEDAGGRCGLVNIGNTCFLNSGIQALSNVEAFSRACCEVPPASMQAHNSLAQAVTRVMMDVWSGRYSYVSPEVILRSLRRVNAMFEGYAQHDAQEALRFLLMDMHAKLAVAVPLSEVPHYVASTSETARPVGSPSAAGTPTSPGAAATAGAGAEALPADATPRDTRAWLRDGPYTGPPTTDQSIVSDLFRGTFTSTVECRECKTESRTREHFFDLSLSIPKRRPPSAPPSHESTSMMCRLFSSPPIRLVDCLYQFVQSEPLEGRDQYYCEHCKTHRNADKTLRIAHAPEVLVVHLKRFNYGSLWGSKVGTTVTFPLSDLDLTPFMAPTLPTPAAGTGAARRPAAGAGVSSAGAAVSPLVAHAGVSMPPYHLVSVVQHMGSLHAGHYVAYARGRNGGWALFDDARVSRVDARRVAKQEAYLLVYQRHRAPASVPKPLSSETKPFCYVSKFWWVKRGCMANPGPASAAVVMCDHDNLKNDLKQHAAQFVVGLTRSQWEWTVSCYGRTRVLMSLNGCIACKREQDALQVRRDAEKRRIRETDTSTIDTNQVWYIISEKWLEQWRQFIDNGGPRDGTGRGALPPGPVSNHLLLRPDGVTPLPNLRKISSFRGVNHNVWRFLHGIYGGGPELPRVQLDIYDTTPIGGGDGEAEDNLPAPGYDADTK